MSIYKPTYLYIKQHTVTGKLYFGKTVQNPEKYNGSGAYWQNHIKKHGIEHVVTLWYCLFLDQESITEFALLCSNQWNIVESEEWANLIEENAIHTAGWNKNLPLSNIHKKHLKENHKGMTGLTHSNETKNKISIALAGKEKPKNVCDNIRQAKLNTIQIANIYILMRESK